MFLRLSRNPAKCVLTTIRCWILVWNYPCSPGIPGEFPRFPVFFLGNALSPVIYQIPRVLHTCITHACNLSSGNSRSVPGHPFSAGPAKCTSKITSALRFSAAAAIRSHRTFAAPPVTVPHSTLQSTLLPCLDPRRNFFGRKCRGFVADLVATSGRHAAGCGVHLGPPRRDGSRELQVLKLV